MAEDGGSSRREVLEDLFLERFSRTELENLESANTRLVEPPIATGSAGPEPRLDEDAYLAALRAQLARRESVAEQDLTALGDARAAAIVADLIERGVPAERIRRLDSDDTKKVVDGRVRLRMRLASEE
jgi:hypothetical protein